MDDDRRRATRMLETLAAAQGLAFANDELADVLTVHIGHRQQAQLLRDGVTLTDEPALLFVPTQLPEECEATGERE